MIREQFGTTRGAVRLGLSYLQVATGLAEVRKADPAQVNRLVFVCLGNICRSSFGEAVARRLGANSVSFGLSTGANQPAHPPAAAVAASLGYDLSPHRTTGIDDYLPLPGDLLLAMEVRQLYRLAADARLQELPRDLLGRWVKMPHLHDPYKLDDAYMLTCLKRIERAVGNLVMAYPGAQLS
jgi:protein-tyrosine phosphatase